MIRVSLFIAVVVASFVAVAHAQQPQTVRCFKDSFGNLRCTDGTTILRDSFGNEIVIPPKRERRAR